jgi:hypothetical protein
VAAGGVERPALDSAKTTILSGGFAGFQGGGGGGGGGEAGVPGVPPPSGRGTGAELDRWRRWRWWWWRRRWARGPDRPGTGRVPGDAGDDAGSVAPAAGGAGRLSGGGNVAGKTLRQKFKIGALRPGGGLTNSN